MFHVTTYVLSPSFQSRQRGRRKVLQQLHSLDFVLLWGWRVGGFVAALFFKYLEICKDYLVTRECGVAASAVSESGRSLQINFAAKRAVNLIGVKTK